MKLLTTWTLKWQMKALTCGSPVMNVITLFLLEGIIMTASSAQTSLSVRDVTARTRLILTNLLRAKLSKEKDLLTTLKTWLNKLTCCAQNVTKVLLMLLKVFTTVKRPLTFHQDNPSFGARIVKKRQSMNINYQRWRATVLHLCLVLRDWTVKKTKNQANT